MEQHSISRIALHKQLALAAMVRSILTMLSAVGLLFLLAATGVLRDFAHLSVILFFGAPMIVCWILTVLICRRMVTCPGCMNSLWSCGNGRFKPRKMKIRTEIARCPHCGIPIV